ncbi:MAG: MBOAT family protein [Lachnospiraceae bacterium]|nr:MBOAT family protein [Lachnospiraceae bacterium]
MLFNSYQFMLFFPVVLSVYFVLPKRIRLYWLLVASYYFYMSWNAKYALLLLFSTSVTYLCGLLLGHWEKQKDRIALSKLTRLKKLSVGISVFMNLSILVFFKYFDFMFRSINAISVKVFHTSLNNPAFDIVLPVGISFYIFQALGYTIDVYRGTIAPEKNFFKYALFVSFFPQLVAGPIERSKNLLKQLEKPASFSFEAFRNGIFLMIWGFFLKIVVADRAAVIVNQIYNNYQQYPGGYLVVATVIFAFQIYCDFAGYSAIAIGTAETLGVKLMENFNAPYLAMSCGEFWRRWHISLSTWFRDYVYIPLGGNRKGKVRKHINILIVFALSGLWHGASWSFAFWGFLNGAYQVIGDLLDKPRKKIVSIFHLDVESVAHRLFRILTTFILIDFSWIFFRAQGIKASIQIIKSIFRYYNPWVLFDGSMFNCGLDQKELRVLVIGIVLLLVVDFFKYKGVSIREVILRQDAWFRWLVFSVSIVFILVFGMWGTGYEGEAFIYFQF